MMQGACTLLSFHCPHRLDSRRSVSILNYTSTVCFCIWQSILLVAYTLYTPVHCEWSGALDSDTPVNYVHFNFSDNTDTMQCPSPANTPSSGPQHGM